MSNDYTLNKGWREVLDKLLETALDAASSAGNDFGKAWVLNAMGATYANLARYEEANGYLEQSLTLRRKGRRSARLQLNFCNNLGRDIPAYGPLRVGHRVTSTGLGRFGRVQRRPQRMVSICLNNLGKAWLALGNIAKAIRCQRLAAGDAPPRHGLARGSGDLEQPGRGVSPMPADSRSGQSYRLALGRVPEGGGRIGSGAGSDSLAELAYERGEFGEAQQRASEALAISATANKDDAPALRRQIDTLQRQLDSVGSLSNSR